jgi:hypothetical protein
MAVLILLKHCVAEDIELIVSSNSISNADA